MCVVLVSWLRDYDFWRVEARKGGGLDLERLRREKRFAFVDGLSGLVMGAQAQAQAEGDRRQRRRRRREQWWVGGWVATVKQVDGRDGKGSGAAI